MVTTKTIVLGWLCLISRVAESPSIPGMRTSIRMRSGRKREHASTASRPSSASPTTSRPSSRASMPLKPWRTRPWSSAITMRAGPDRPSVRFSLPLIAAPSHIALTRQRDLRHHRRACPGFARDLKAAPEQRDPLLHAGEADPLSRLGLSLPAVGGEPAPPVADLEAKRLAASPERDAHLLRLRVLAHVRQGLLGDPEEGCLHHFWQALSSQVFLEGRPKPLLGEPLHLQAERSRQPEVVEHRGTQVGDHSACLSDGVPEHF